MPTFSTDGERHVVSYITGPSHVYLGLVFSDQSTTAPVLVRKPPIGKCHHGELDESAITEAVAIGIREASPTLFASEITYVADDSPRYSLYAHCAKLLAQQYIDDASSRGDKPRG